MRHRKSHRKLSRSVAHRRALMRHMATSFLKAGRIETTVAKAKELRRVVEPLIRLASEDSLTSRRKALNYITDRGVVHRLFVELGPRYKTREGGYTRIVRTRHRHGDAAEMACIELVEAAVQASGAKSAKTAKPSKAEPAATA